MKVSVCVRTYNHEAFVDQSVGGALAQETDFDFEVVVGDDGSSDKTQEILKQYQARHPERLRLLLRDTNIGSKNNLVDTYNTCQGEYVAFLDGDDYWIETNKLQSQVDYMEAHPDVAICGTRWRRASGVHPPWTRSTRTMSEYIHGGRGLLMSILMARRSCLPEFPDWIHRTYLVDVVIIYLCLKHGKLAYLDGVTMFYREHEMARASQLSAEETIRWDTTTWEEILKDSDPPYRRLIKRRLAAAYYRLADLHRLANRKEDGKLAFDQARKLGTSMDLLRHHLRSRAPGLYRVILKAREAISTR